MASARRYEMSFFTATILEWKYLLSDDDYKKIVIGILRYLVEKKRVLVHAFVIMNNHIHLLWHVLHPDTLEDVQRDFLKYTAQMMIKDLRTNNTELLKDYYVGAKDRKHQIWERSPLSIDIWTEYVVRQKLQYIHNNPVRAGLCTYEDEYKYSSAALYNGKEDTWGFVTPAYF